MIFLKRPLFFIAFLCITVCTANQVDSTQASSKGRTSKYSKEADTLRKNHLSPSSVSIKKGHVVPMPDAKPGSGDKMNSKPAESKDRMPVKTPADTLEFK